MRHATDQHPTASWARGNGGDNVRLWRTAFCLFMAAIAGAGGCSRRRVQYDRSYVSRGIEERTGHRLAPAARTGEPSVPQGVTIENGVSEDEAVALALWNNAAFEETLADLGLARADLVQAGLLPNPVFSLLFPTDVRHWESTLSFSVDALFFRPRRIAIAELQSKHVGERLMQNGLDLVRDVHVAYVDLALARDRARIGEETAQLLGRIADLSEKRLRAGDLSEFEATAARIDAIRSRGDTAVLARDVMLADQRLRALVGYGFVETNLAFEEPGKSHPITEEVETLAKEALVARPDFRAAEVAIEAAAKQAKLAPWEFLKLDLILDGDEIAPFGFKVGPGFRLPLPIFNRNQDGVARARARLEQTIRHRFALRDQIRLEVAQAYTHYVQACEKLEYLRTQVLSQLEEAADRAEKAFENGNISFLLVLETARRLLETRGREVEAVAALRGAQAELERSVGWRLDFEPVRAESKRKENKNEER